MVSFSLVYVDSRAKHIIVEGVTEPRAESCCFLLFDSGLSANHDDSSSSSSTSCSQTMSDEPTTTEEGDSDSSEDTEDEDDDDVQDDDEGVGGSTRQEIEIGESVSEEGLSQQVRAAL